MSDIVMRPRFPGRRLAALLVAALAAGCATAGAANLPPPGGGQPGAAATDPDAERRAELEALYRAQTAEALGNFSPADVAFMQGMIVHHTQALVMAGLAERNDAGEGVRTLASRILLGQRDEIATMEAWLADRGLPAPEIRIQGVEVVVEGMHLHHDMPGMISPEEMRRLEAARGPEFDRLFLTCMIEHHRGAIAMVEELLATDGAALDPFVFKFASDIQAEQTSEIARMERMLAGTSP